MPTPAVALKLKKFRRRFGITAPRVVVRSYMSWPWRMAGSMFLLVLLLGGTSLFYRSGEVGLLNHELESLRLQVREQQDELILLRATTGTEQNAVRMEKSVQQQLLTRIRGLESENSALKEDIRLFERLISVPGEEVAVRIEAFRVQQEGDGRFRYRLLLAYQSGKMAPEFRGHLQFSVVFSVAGKDQRLILPTKPVADASYQLEIRNFLRREGVMELPPGARLKEVEARVMSGDTLKAKRVAQL